MKEKPPSFGILVNVYYRPVGSAVFYNDTNSGSIHGFLNVTLKFDVRLIVVSDPVVAVTAITYS